MNKLTVFQLGQRLRDNLLSGVPMSGSVRDSSTISESEFKRQLALGLVSPVVWHQEAVSAEPVGYFYGHVRTGDEAPLSPKRTINGVEYVGVDLPNIEILWTDKERYPYAYVLMFLISTVVIFTDEPIYRANNTNAAGAASEGNYQKYERMYIDGELQYVGEFHDRPVFGSYDVLWSSENVFYAKLTGYQQNIITPTDELYFTPSDPIPVYE